MLLNHLSSKHRLQLRPGQSLPISGSPLIAPNIQYATHARTQTSTKTKQTKWSYWHQNQQSLRCSLMLSSNTTCIVWGTTWISWPVLLFSWQLAYVRLSRRAQIKTCSNTSLGLNFITMGTHMSGLFPLLNLCVASTWLSPTNTAYHMNITSTIWTRQCLLRHQHGFSSRSYLISSLFVIQTVRISCLICLLHQLQQLRICLMGRYAPVCPHASTGSAHTTWCRILHCWGTCVEPFLDLK